MLREDAAEPYFAHDADIVFAAAAYAKDDAMLPRSDAAAFHDIFAAVVVFTLLMPRLLPVLRAALLCSDAFRAVDVFFLLFTPQDMAMSHCRALRAMRAPRLIWGRRVFAA